jgi:acetyl-CoA C-acetyltransferase
MTVNRVCGSGAQAIASAAQEVMLGMLDSAVAGGIENMDMAPYLVANGRWGYRMGDAELKSRKRPKVFDKDEHNRPDTTMESLAKLHPAFRKDGAITAGNAPGLNSGAVAMIVAERGWAEQHKLEPMARLVSYGIGAVEPGMFGLGPIPAVRQALDRAGWKLGDIERIEINEAFAAIAIEVTRELGLAEDIVNVEGGAIAHGHPIGATGAVLSTRLFHSMKRDGIERGVVTLCIGGRSRNRARA